MNDSISQSIAQRNAGGRENPKLHHPLALLWGMAFLVVFQAAKGEFPPFLKREAVYDPDSFMRLLRVEHLWQTGEWYARNVPAGNAPIGDDLHWTRLFDLLIIAIAWPLEQFLPMRPAIYTAGCAVPLLLGFGALLLFSFASRRVLTSPQFALLAILLFMNPTVSFVFRWGYVDHHSLQIFLFVAVLALISRLEHGFERGRATTAGLVLALALWTSVEAFTTAFLACATLGLLWISGEERRIHQVKRVLLGVVLALLLVILIERGPQDFFAVEYDKISVAHLFFFAAFSIAWWLLAYIQLRAPVLPFGRRLALSIGAVGLPIAAMYAAFPLFFEGVLVGLDPLVYPLLFENNTEFRPFAYDDPEALGVFFVYAGPVFIAVPYAVLRLLRGPAHERSLHLFTLLAIVLFLALTLQEIRWTAYVASASALPWLLVLIAIWRSHAALTVMGRRILPLRYPGFALAMFGHVVIGVIFLAATGAGDPGAERKLEARCPWDEISAHLVASTFNEGRRATILTTMFQGPELAYRSGHRVVGSPYHRNVAAIIDNRRFLSGEGEEDGREIVERRKVDYVLLCRHSVSVVNYTAAPRENLTKRLVTGKSPSWLIQEQLPEPLSEHFVLYRTLP